MDDIKPDPQYEGIFYLGQTELWTTSRCAIQLNYKSHHATAVVDKVMRRKGLTPYLRLSGSYGSENLWLATKVNKLPRRAE